MEIEKIKHRGYDITIHSDDDAESPDIWGNDDAFLVYDHRDFTVNREGFNPDEIFERMQEKKKTFSATVIVKQFVLGESAFQNGISSKPYWFFPVYAYIHSGVALSLGRNSYPFNDRWDVSFKGFALVQRQKGWSWKEDQAYKIAQELVEEWNMYLSGQVYGYDSECGSCWGFYGDTEYMLEEAKAEIDSHIKQERKKHWNQMKLWIKNRVPLRNRYEFSHNL